jgi:release factor glutamine methyltransferase
MVRGTRRGGTAVLEGVYPPSEDSYLLMEAVARLPAGRVLELCSGTGIVGLSLASRASRVIAVDINPVAVMNTVLNYRGCGFSERLDAVAGDLFSPLRIMPFDLVIMNPPYVEDERVVGDTAWSGGKGGRDIIDRFLDSVSGYLAEGGRGVFVQSDLNGLEETRRRAEVNGMRAEVVGERVFRFETLLAVEVRTL